MSRKLAAYLLVTLLTAGVCIVTVLLIANASHPDPKVNLNISPLVFMLYQDGQPAGVGELPADSSAFSSIKKLIEDTRGNWRGSMVSYAPGVLIQGRDFTINILEKTVIVNSHDDAGNPQ